MAVTVLIVDDHESVADALRRAWRGELDVVGIAQDGSRAIEMAKELQPDVVLMDIMMPGRDAFETTREVVTLGSKVLFFTGFAMMNYLEKALTSGASGIFYKGEPGHLLIDIIQRVAKGEQYWSSKWEKHLPEYRMEAAPPREIEALTDAHLNILNSLAGGESQQAIAAAMGIPRRAFTRLLREATRKLGARSTAEAIANAVREGVILSKS